MKDTFAILLLRASVRYCLRPVSGSARMRYALPVTRTHAVVWQAVDRDQRPTSPPVVVLAGSAPRTAVASGLTTTNAREDAMTHVPRFAGSPFCFCSACNSSPALSRRQFLCTTAATAVAASTAIGTSSETARAQQPSGGTARAILIK